MTRFTKKLEQEMNDKELWNEYKKKQAVELEQIIIIDGKSYRLDRITLEGI